MNWWRTRSLKVRLACLHGVANLCIMGLLASVVFLTVGRKLRADLDRQLQRDFAFVQAGLEFEDGLVEWELTEHSEDGRPAAPVNFDVWNAKGNRLVFHGHQPAGLPDPDLTAGPEGAFSHSGEEPIFRILQQPVRIDGRSLLLRVYRDQQALLQALSGLGRILLVMIPVAVTLASVGGYLVASRSLEPVSAISRQAKRISAHSLDERLNVPNPHDEIGRLAGVFNDTFERLENAFEEMKRFTSDASHELRTPLTALRAVGEVSLKDTDNPEAQREAIGSMLEEAERLNDLIGTLLELARSDHGSPPKVSPVALDEMVDEIVATLGPLTDERQLTLRVAGQPGCRALADPALLRQALLNMVHNAIFHSPPDTEVRIEAGSMEDQVFVDIIDNGPGIAPEHHDRVFDRFYRIDKARSRAHGGYGLGLAIARTAAEHMGGTITLRSEVGKGCCFRTTLPAATASSRDTLNESSGSLQ